MASDDESTPFLCETIISLPGRSPGGAVVLSPAFAWALALTSALAFASASALAKC